MQNTHMRARSQEKCTSAHAHQHVDPIPAGESGTCPIGVQSSPCCAAALPCSIHICVVENEARERERTTSGRGQMSWNKGCVIKAFLLRVNSNEARIHLRVVTLLRTLRSRERDRERGRTAINYGRLGQLSNRKG